MQNMEPRTLGPTALKWGSRLGADMIPRCQVLVSVYCSTLSTHSHVLAEYPVMYAMRDIVYSVGRTLHDNSCQHGSQSMLVKLQDHSQEIQFSEIALHPIS